MTTLVRFCRQHPWAIAGASCYQAEDQTLQETGAIGRRRRTAHPGEVIAVDEMSGYCVCIPVAIVKRLGLPNYHRFPHYYRDCTYILRATRSGFSAYLIGDARIDHEGTIKSTIQDFLPTTANKPAILCRFRSVFFGRKSLFFLPTQFFYYLKKYTFFPGIFLFFIKLIGWSTQLCFRAKHRPI
ncbi:MAG: hypothetical protein HC890_16845 [Chloroflexaceae bacterium]|nr:hypothetical protein [Chloroflexaceae bacterium]